jgi:biopolymer transport protein TolR
MPTLSASRGRRKRFVSEINVVPYIDVMLVLLVIFMVTAPLIPTGQIDLPTVGRAGPQQQAEPYVEVVVAADGSLRVLTRNSPLQMDLPVQRPGLAGALREARGGDPRMPVVISGDGKARYEQVLEVMDEARSQGVERVGLMVRTRP